MQFDIRRFDIYRKVPKDLTNATITGACVSIASVVFIVFLITTEFLSFLTVETANDIYVSDPGDSEQHIPVFVNITLPSMPCKALGLDIQDTTGRHEVSFKLDTNKTDLNNGAGCCFVARFSVQRVSGNFHIASHNIAPQNTPSIFNMTHRLNELYFGENVTSSKTAHKALAGVDRLKARASSSHHYQISIVPTYYQRYDRETLESAFQYSYTYKEMGVQVGHGGRVQAPTLWFDYAVSPLTIKYTERRKPFYHFITTFCAIIGGTFTVAGVVDSLLFTVHSAIKKAEIGKLS